MERNMDLLREFLSSLGLDEAIRDYLRDALDDCKDLDWDELTDFLQPYLAADEVDKMLHLIKASSDSSLRQASTVEATQKADDDEAFSLAITGASTCSAAAENVEQTIRATEQELVQRDTKCLLTERRVLRTKARKESQLDEADLLESDGFVVDEACVLKARCIKTGHHVMIKDRPCRVDKVGTSKIWKGPFRGCFQSQIVAHCIFTGKKFEHTCPATEDVSMAAVQRQECTVMDIGDDGELSLLTSAYETKSDVNLPTGTDGDRKLAECIKTDFHDGKNVMVVVLSSCGIEKIVQHKSKD